MNRTLLSPHHVSSMGLPVAIPSKLSTLNATAWIRIGKRRAAAIAERRAMERKAMNGCDNDCNKARDAALSLPHAR